MNLDEIRTLIAVVRRGSLVAVARDRDVDPSSISRSIASLEKSLGIRLLQRTTRKLDPTEAGLAYLARVEPLLEELERARDFIQGQSQKLTGTIRILAPVSFGLLNLVPLIPAMALQHPGLIFDLVLTDSPVDLIAERIDLALGLGPIRDSNFVVQQLAPLAGRVCASPAYLQQHGRPQSPPMLSNHNCLLLDYPGFGDDWWFTSADGEKLSVAVAGNVRSSNAVALKQCALSSMGIILQASWIVGEELRAGSLIDLFPSYEATAATYTGSAVWAMYPSRTYLPQKVRVVLNALKKSYASARKGSDWTLNGS